MNPPTPAPMPLDPDAELLAHMSQWGLNPGRIVWDGRFHRFPGVDARRGTDDAGWYKAFPDREGAVFGCKRTGLTEKWQLRTNQRDDFDPEAWAKKKKEWAEQDKLRAKERLKAERAAAAISQREWKNSEPADADHPYLKKKGVTGPEVRALRVNDKGQLLVPMKGLGKANPIQSLQRINPDGEKRFQYQARVSATRTTIGARHLKRDPDGKPLPWQTIYVTEGWATGWSISEAAQAPVLVCFMRDNLEAITRYAAEAFPGQRIVVACDNDRWSKHFDDDNNPVANPGVYDGRRAAEAVGASYAVPDFEPEHLPAPGEKGPTDFNDLHQLGGPAAVRRWLDPDMASEAVTVAPELRAELESREAEASAPDPVTEEAAAETPAPEPTPEEPGPEEEDEGPPPTPTWMETAPFRCLGFDRGPTYYYLPRGTGQIHAFTPPSHRRETLLTLAPASWWESHFPANNGTSWPTAADALFRACERVGVFRPERLRGRGCWLEEGPDGEDRVVVHLGDRLLPPDGKQFVDPEGYQDPEGRIYERHPRLTGPSQKRALALKEATKVLDLFQDLLWHEEASGYLLAGWTVLAPLCGALPWRPHVWLTGDAGAGKTTLLKSLVVPLTGGMRRYFEGGTSEAGIRQRLGSDGLPVIYDEAEKQDARSDDRVQSVLALARSASSTGDAEVAKGTTHGRAMSFQIRSMFLLSSIGGSLRQEADKTRVSILQLHGSASVDKTARRGHWERYRPKLETVTPELGRQLVSRSLGWLRDGRLADTLRTLRTAASVVLGDARSGDQYGTLYAGAWTLMSDKPPTPEEARELVGGEDLSEYIAEQMPAGKRALQVLLQQRERIDTSNGPRTVSVGKLIDAACGHVSSVSDGEANEFLRPSGFKVDVEGGERVLLVATQSEWIDRALKDTPYQDGLHQALRTLPGVRSIGQTVRFATGLVSRATRVPIHLITD